MIGESQAVTDGETLTPYIHSRTDLHSDVHLTPALQYLQFSLHIFVLCNHSVRRWHMPCLRQQGLSKTYYGHPIPTPIYQVRYGSICLLTVTCFQINLACNRDLLTRSKSVAWVGGILSNERLPVKNKLYLSSLTYEEAHVLLYINTTNRLLGFMCTLSRVKHSGSLVRAINVSVRSILPCIPVTLLATADMLHGPGAEIYMYVCQSLSGCRT